MTRGITRNYHRGVVKAPLAISTAAKQCCYDAIARQSSTDAQCIFNFPPEQLINVGNYWFCPYHLPWSPLDLQYRFGIQVADDDPSRLHLKENWGAIQRAHFHNDLIGRIVNTEGNIDLAGLVAAGDLRVEEIVCRSYLNIADAYFPGTVVFRNVRFFWVNFKSAEFQMGANFTCIFDFDAEFSNALFRDVVTFDGCNFSARALFDRASFLGRATFNGAVFNREGEFINSYFAANAEFRNSVFKWPVAFRGAEFRGIADFSCYDPDLPEIKYADFSECKFDSEVSFERREFASQLDFKGSLFRCAPKFYGSSVPFTVTFPPIKSFLDWQRGYRLRTGYLISRPESYYFYNGELSNRYRTLRYLMKQQDAYQEEAMFWELEMRTKERSLPINRPENWLLLIISVLYRCAARYGNSISRPAVLWVLLSIGFAAAYYFLDGQATFKWDIVRILNAYEFSLQQTIRPFSIWSNEGKELIRQLFGPVPNTIPIFLVRLAATAQTAISLTLLALFVFAIRRRFRMI
jgi:uncharacterized protein YjbI with pentapeptide repeats